MRILSVFLSNARIVTKQEKSVQIFIPYERSFILFSDKKIGWWGGDPFYLKLWVHRPLLERNRRF